MVTVQRCLITTHEAENASVENGATIQQSTDMESTAVEATNQTYVELPKRMRQLLSMSLSQPML